MDGVGQCELGRETWRVVCQLSCVVRWSNTMTILHLRALSGRRKYRTMTIYLPRQKLIPASNPGKCPRKSRESSCGLTRICFVCLLSFLNAPADLLNLLTDVIVANLLLFDFLIRSMPCCTPFVDLLFDALGNDSLEIGNDPFLNRSCDGSSQSAVCSSRDLPVRDQGRS